MGGRDVGSLSIGQLPSDVVGLLKKRKASFRDRNFRTKLALSFEGLQNRFWRFFPYPVW